jgi:hypothetical protein
VPGAKEATLDPAIVNAVAQQTQGLKDLKLKFYISDTDPEKLVNDYNSALTAAGYVAAFPFSKQGDGYNAVYGKAGGVDAIISVQPVPGDEQQLAKNANLPGVSDTAMKTLLDQVKGHKSIVFVISAPDLLKTLFQTAAATVSANTPAATTPAATPVPATTAASSTTASASSRPYFTNADFVNTDAVIAAAVYKQVKNISQVGDNVLVSNDEVDKVVTMVEDAYTTAGYKNELGNHLSKNGSSDAYAGVYTKAGADDHIVAVFTVPTTTGELSKLLNIPQLTQADYQKLLDGMKGKKSAILLITGPNLYKLLLDSLGGNNRATPEATVAATTSASNSGDVTEADIPVYTGAKRVDAASTNAGGMISVYYLSKDDDAQVAGWAKQAFTGKGWQGVTSTEVGGATFVKGTKGKYSVSTTILGAKARGNTNYDPIFKLASAGADDTVIFTIITKA